MSLWQKYRPGLDGIKGNDKLVASVRKMFSNPEHPHAFLVTGEPGGGKAQPLYSRILTPDGWKAMGDIKVGDVVISGDGDTTPVLGVFPQGKRPVYSIKLGDGTEFRAADNHLHRVQYRKKQRWPSAKSDFVTEDVTTLQLIHMVERHGRNRAYLNNVYIPTVTVQGCDVSLPIDPYLLGVLIGDGSMQGNNFGVSLPETDVLERVRKLLLEEGCVLVRADSAKYDYRIRRDESKYPSIQALKDDESSLKNKVRALGLDTYSVKKHIPPIYLKASFRDRLALMQGLMDTDGYIGQRVCRVKSGQYRAIGYEFSTSSPQLSEDFAYLARSLGLVDHIASHQTHYITPDGERRECSVAYRHALKVPNSLRIVSSAKHLAKWQPRQCGDQLRRRIVSIDYIGEEECQCIYVEADCHTYITDNVTVTHNTTIARAIANELLGSKVIIENDNGNDRGKEAMSALAADMSLRPILGKTKVCILDEAHKLTPDAKSALLKPVEEAAPWAYYFFCTPDPDKLFQGKDGEALKTRLTVLKLKKPSDAEIGDILRDVMRQEGFSIKKSEGEAIIASCHRNPREAVKLLETVRFGEFEQEDEEKKAQVIDLCRALMKGWGSQGKGWPDVAKILAQLKEDGTDPETIRRVVLGYAQAIVLKGTDDVKALDILDIFSAPTFDAGFPKITLAAMKVCHCS